MKKQTIRARASEEQLLYADILNKGMLVGLLLLIITFALYLLGILKPVVPVEMVSSYWNQDVHSYLAAVNQNFLHWEHPPTGWSWIYLIGKGDFLNFMPVAILSGVTIICFLAIVPGLLRRGDKAYAVMAVAEAVILGLAASGLLAAGH